MSRRKRAHQLVDQVADQAEALVEQVTPHVEAIRETMHPAPKPRRRGRKVLTLLALLGVAAGVLARQRGNRVDQLPGYAPQPAPPDDVDPVPPGAIGDHDPAPEDVARLENEAPLPPDDSLSSFFSELDEQTAQGSDRG